MAIAEATLGKPTSVAPTQSSGRLARYLGVAWSAGLAVLVLALRVPFGARMLNGWDGVNYALALRHFDLAIQQPHLPGYLFYVGTAWAINLLVRDPSAAYVVVSMLGTVLATLALLLLSQRLLMRRSMAVATALLLVTSPLFWFWGEVQSPYVFLAGGSALIAYLCLRAMDGGARWLIVAAAALGLGGGFRPDLVPFLFPLLAFSGVRGRHSAYHLLCAGAVLAACLLLWLVPLFVLAGGVGAYIQLSVQQAGGALGMSGHTALDGIRSAAGVAARFLGWMLWGLGPAAIGLAALARRGDAMMHGHRAFFIVWLAPAMVFFVGVHLGQSGYLLMVLPGVLILAVAGIARAVAKHRLGTKPLIALWAILILANAAVFLNVRAVSIDTSHRTWAYFQDELDTWLFNLTAPSIDAHDRWLGAIIVGIRGAGPPCCTALVLTDSNVQRYPQYELADYPQYVLPAQVRLGSEHRLFINGTRTVGLSDAIVLPSGVTSLVWIGEPTFSGAQAGLRRLDIPGAIVFIVPLTQPVRYGRFTFYPHGYPAPEAPK